MDTASPKKYTAESSYFSMNALPTIVHDPNARIYNSTFNRFLKKKKKYLISLLLLYLEIILYTKYCTICQRNSQGNLRCRNSIQSMYKARFLFQFVSHLITIDP